MLAVHTNWEGSGGIVIVLLISTPDNSRRKEGKEGTALPCYFLKPYFPLVLVVGLSDRHSTKQCKELNLSLAEMDSDKTSFCGRMNNTEQLNTLVCLIDNLYKAKQVELFDLIKSLFLDKQWKRHR